MATCRSRSAELDDLLPQDSPVSFIKCDVEGHEFTVVEGAERLLKRAKPALLVEIEERHGQTVGEVVGYLSDRGYTCQSLKRNGDLDPFEGFNARSDRLDAEDDEQRVTDFLFVHRDCQPSQ